jgi:hypothetical protein
LVFSPSPDFSTCRHVPNCLPRTSRHTPRGRFSVDPSGQLARVHSRGHVNRTVNRTVNRRTDRGPQNPRHWRAGTDVAVAAMSLLQNCPRPDYSWRSTATGWEPRGVLQLEHLHHGPPTVNRSVNRTHVTIPDYTEISPQIPRTWRWISNTKTHGDGAVTTDSVSHPRANTVAQVGRKASVS